MDMAEKEKNEGNENVIRLTTPEFIYLLQKFDTQEEKIRKEITELRQEFRKEVAGLKEEISDIRKEVNDVRKEVKSLIWTTFTLMVATIGIAVTVAVTVLK